MPELPEVQTIVNDLNQNIKGETISRFWSDWNKGIKISLSKFKKKNKNAKIVDAARIGKHIIIHLDNNYSIIIHLKMTGHLLYKRKNLDSPIFQERVNNYVHHIFYFISGNTLEFSDLRKFGWLNLVPTKNVNEQKSIKKLGIDALLLTSIKFKNLINKYHKAKIGIFLLNQDIISGIGNIYRSEILFDARINPKKLNSKLSNVEVENILISTKKILKKAIKLRGTTDSDYRDTKGESGKFQTQLKVYRKENQPCVACAKIITKEKLAQRSVFYCQSCQK
ncbi:DNA-formamidopyrimidine glycosylase [Patescibacteria group bacterium]|nr:DNA-formamidopyrimidine glycosylase [Patescibacteria group bacterium]